jgi:glucosamine-6-phosphate deaminase
MMQIAVYPSPEQASQAAAIALARWLNGSRTLVVAGGNSPRELYRLVAGLPASNRLHVFTLDEYLGVPRDDPRTCANLLRREVADAWHIPPERFHALSSRIEDAGPGIVEHERQLAACGGLDVVVLGLGRNGHLGFNEPGSSPRAPGRVVNLTPTSIAANAEWFGGEYAPAQGVTLGLQTILAARYVLLVAFGAIKADAVHGMVVVPPNESCPGAWLQLHPNAHVYLDEPAAAWVPSDRYLRED